MRVAGQSTEAQEQLQEVEKRLAELAQEERRILNDTNSINEKFATHQKHREKRNSTRFCRNNGSGKPDAPSIK